MHKRTWRDYLRIWKTRLSWRWKEHWARKYNGKGVVEIEKLSDSELVYRVFDFVFQNYVTYDKKVRDYDTSGLTPAEAALFYAWDVDCEVVNGGYNQYFLNKSGRSPEPIREAYRLLGANQHARLFDLAWEDHFHVRFAHYQARKKLRDGIQAFLAEVSLTYKDNPLNDLDFIYYELKPTMKEILVRYIRENPDRFQRC
jgi:hypothetical protein